MLVIENDFHWNDLAQSLEAGVVVEYRGEKRDSLDAPAIALVSERMTLDTVQ